MDFDVVVIGGGHAGTEAAHAAARMGRRTALLSMNPSRIGFMSCNPAIGGLAKGQLVKEIDALGGIMGRNTDQTAIQYRRLNTSKGPAVRSSRAQCDKALYATRMQERLATVPGLTILPFEAVDLEIDATGQVSAVVLGDGSRLTCRAAIITSGTFLRAVMHTGFDQSEGGRVGDDSSKGLSLTLERFGFRLGRLKTGTPPRLDRRSIDFSRAERQPGDIRPLPFSFYFRPAEFPVLPQVDCYITYTNEKTHGIIERNFERSPLFTGVIQGVGPRYCPSIEDKVKRFRDRSRHQLFLEPEGLSTDEIYVNGISTSLPKDVQEEFVRTVPGLEKAEFIRYGYAVEYDCVDARQLRATLESKSYPGLFFAGQINGTSGYEEAAAQGLIAGINAARRAVPKSSADEEPFTLARHDGYIGVLIDDLITKGTDEPYRMFTSRAEYRLLLREDNADLRLSPYGHALGLLSAEDFGIFETRRNEVSRLREGVRTHFFYPTVETNDQLGVHGLSLLKDRSSAENMLKRPEVDWKMLCDLGFPGGTAAADVGEQVEIQVKYEGYIQRDLDLLEGTRKNERMAIPIALDFESIPGLSNEVRSRLSVSRPETIGQASRLAGITPAAVASIMIYLKMAESRTAHGRA